MSHARRAWRPGCELLVLLLIALPSQSVVNGQVASANPQLWATPTRFQGMTTFRQEPGRTRAPGPRSRMGRRVELSDYSFSGPPSESHKGFSSITFSHGRSPGGVGRPLVRLSAAVEPVPYDAGDAAAPGRPEVLPEGALGGPPAVCDSCGDGAVWEGEYYEDVCGCATCTAVDGGPWGAYGPWGMAPGAAFWTLRYTSITLGVSGFKNASNLGADGSFGFHEGVNYGAPLPLIPETGLGWQVGFRTVQSDLSGTNFTDAQRNQTFFTTGVFRRVGAGLQGGVVFDLLRDVWYDRIDVSQIRGEISWKCPLRHEWGYWFAAGDDRDGSLSPLVPGRVDVWEPTDLHAFFYRRRFACLTAAEGRFYAGFSGEGDGLLGADATIPVNNRWIFRSTFTYLIPEEPTGAGGGENEGWNIALAGVWHFGRNAQVQPSRYTPLFDVADNGTFFVDQVAP